MSHTANTIYSFIETLTPLYRLLASDFTTDDRQSMGTHCFEQAPELVRDTAAVFRDSGTLFPEISIDTNALADQQEDADAVRALHAHMLVLSRLSSDAVLSLQSQATKTSMAAFHHALATLPYQPERLRRLRLLALSRIANHVPRQHRTRLSAQTSEEP